MKASRASFFAPGLAFDPKDSQGLNVGNNAGDQTVAPGESRTYTYYAHPANKETTSLVWDGGNIVVNPRNGLYGAIVIGPKGSQYRDPITGADVSQKNTWRADVIVDTTLSENAGKRNYRDVALFFQDEDNIIGTAFMPYVQNVAGLTSVNYRAEPYKFREEQGCSLGKIFQPCAVDKPEDPVTPLIEAHAGDPVRIHVIGANSEQNGMFGVEGHEWPIEPYMAGADMISVVIRQSLVQLETPEAMRGRVSAVNSVFIGASNELGEFRAGTVAALMLALRGQVPMHATSVVIGGRA